MPATAPLRHLKECRKGKCNTGEIPHATLRKSLCIFEEKVLAKNTEEPAVIEIDGRRNSLERCMLKFADYEKRTEYDEKRGVYICSICYDIQDETELIIDLLSFGPVIRVVSPERIVRQIRERVMRQHEWLFGAVE